MVPDQSRPCVDDPTISSDEKLWRRIHPDNLEEINGIWRASSGAFKTQEMSVHISSLTTIENALEGYAEFSLAEFPASLPRRFGLRIVRDPTPEDPSHAFVCPKATGGQAKIFKEESIFAVLKLPSA
jgi:hypothetical protein